MAKSVTVESIDVTYTCPKAQKQLSFRIPIHDICATIKLMPRTGLCDEWAFRGQYT